MCEPGAIGPEVGQHLLHVDPGLVERDRFQEQERIALIGVGLDPLRHPGRAGVVAGGDENQIVADRRALQEVLEVGLTERDADLGLAEQVALLLATLLIEAASLVAEGCAHERG